MGGLNKYFYPVTLNKTLYQRRPLWAGNEGVDEKDVGKLDQTQRDQVMLFEACKLGGLHAKSNSEPMQIEPTEWDQVAQSLEKQFLTEFGQ